MRRVYYDSSAVVKLLREEDFTADIARWVDNPRMEAVSGRLTETEVRRMAERDGIPQDLVTETLDRFEIFGHPDWEFRAAGVIPARSLRALDALHIAAAIRIQADAIITSGGVSVGEADYTKAMMKQLGDVAFWKIAMRPGRPMAVGRIPAGNQRSTILFGLPGNPVAVMVTFLAFVRPALLQMMGCSAKAPPLLKARSLEALRKKPGRTEYQRGIVRSAPDGTLQVATTGNQGSGVLSSMVQANGLIVLPHDGGNVAAGDVVEVMVFDGVM